MSLREDGAFSDASKGEAGDETVRTLNRNESDDGDDLRHAKVGRLSQESSACNVTSSSVSASPKNSPWVLPSGTGNISASKGTVSNLRRGKLKTNDEIGSENAYAHSSFDNGRVSEKYILTSSDDSAMEEDFTVESDGLRFLSSPDWPQIVYDVSSQDITVHIPFHRFL
ncbi:hypothetical protein KIW84_051380 [Lathyrus oleraceus]|uniref:Uncharacterized protein n=1 Tax=Pisum sativum TaxID=3888 RepID=A0A9D5AFW1_PEA|nr:hypothetical protein KIW84_051380 [Pisum sativum]